MNILKKLGYVEVAKALGVSRQTVAKWATGEIEISLKNALKISDYYDIPLIYLLDNNVYRIEELERENKLLKEKLKAIEGILEVAE